MGRALASWLVRRTQDQAVRVRALAGVIELCQSWVNSGRSVFRDSLVVT